MQLPDDLQYTTEHEWVRVEGAEAIVGITDFAQEELGDVVFVELPAVGHGAHGGTDLRRRRVEQERLRPVRAGRRAGWSR